MCKYIHCLYFVWSFDCHRYDQWKAHADTDQIMYNYTFKYNSNKHLRTIDVQLLQLNAFVFVHIYVQKRTWQTYDHVWHFTWSQNEKFTFAKCCGIKVDAIPSSSTVPLAAYSCTELSDERDRVELWKTIAGNKQNCTCISTGSEWRHANKQADLSEEQDPGLYTGPQDVRVTVMVLPTVLADLTCAQTMRLISRSLHSQIAFQKLKLA